MASAGSRGEDSFGGQQRRGKPWGEAGSRLTSSRGWGEDSLWEAEERIILAESGDGDN
eukprot:CAMPEP_0201921438 /NCGR_PEP_ID=MMETSP0903-20130614/9766_1 /ASSEMBLY_ACC=CAM_ASM_000552 /TAXON_ID=420261 /ORGANISM="Thalassiosira antarctica, Strain CCMP982" /LENGTH=57 /DNA_ID=CAMNT_0048458397 /DNA_START=695 /DNA_END=865 /DNA_ORIENTATION=+